MDSLRLQVIRAGASCLRRVSSRPYLGLRTDLEEATAALLSAGGWSDCPPLTPTWGAAESEL